MLDILYSTSLQLIEALKLLDLPQVLPSSELLAQLSHIVLLLKRELPSQARYIEPKSHTALRNRKQQGRVDPFANRRP